MGDFFKAVLAGWNEGKDRAIKGSYRRQDKNKIPVELVEPSTGRCVKFVVTEKNNRVAEMYMDQLITYAKGLNAAGWIVEANTIKIVFADSSIAESVRQDWRKG